MKTPNSNERAKPKSAFASRVSRAIIDRLSCARQTTKLVWRSCPWLLIAVAILVGVSAALGPAIVWVGKEIVDGVVASQRPLSSEITQVAKHSAKFWVLVELVLVVLSMLTDRATNVLQQIMGARLSMHVTTMVLEKALGMELQHFEDSKFYDQLTRARREASSRPVVVVQQYLQVLKSGLTLVGYISLLIRFSPWAVLACVVAAAPVFISEIRYSRTAFRLRNWRSPDSRRLTYLEHVLTTDTYAKEVKILDIGSVLINRYKELAKTFYDEDIKICINRGAWAASLSGFGLCVYYAFYALVVISATKSLITIGEMTLAVLAFRQAQASFQSMLMSISGIYEANLYMSNLFEYLALKSERSIEGSVIVKKERGIRFDGVGFQYPGTAVWALRDISLYVPDKKSIALVGHNGAGKSTFVKLLTGLYRPTEGSVYIDGCDIAGLSGEEVRRRFGIVFQDFCRYQFSAKDNILLGDIDSAPDDRRVELAAQSGDIDSFINGLPKRFETQLGRLFPDGVELSGGQWQRVALARAFVRQGADIWIFDEPTASLDPQTEYELLQRFKALSSQRTSFLISHRFPMARIADQIFVFNAGRIIESGTHEELVSARGYYARLFDLQARGYR